MHLENKVGLRKVHVCTIVYVNCSKMVICNPEQNVYIPCLPATDHHINHTSVVL